MIAEMSKASGIYHRPGCRYLKNIKLKNQIAFDMEDSILKQYKPCECCCSINGVYREFSSKPHTNLDNLGIQTMLRNEAVYVHTNHYDWKITLKKSSQNLHIFRSTVNDEEKNYYERHKGIKKCKNINALMGFIVNEECIADYPEPYRDSVAAVRSYVKDKNIQVGYDGNNMYIMTEVALWKITYYEDSECYKLYHCPFDGNKPTMEQARHAHYHRQSDVSMYQSVYKHIKYIDKHDEAKKIMDVDYRKLPKSTHRQKRYYEQAKRRAAYQRQRRVFELLEEMSDNKRSVC